MWERAIVGVAVDAEATTTNPRQKFIAGMQPFGRGRVNFLPADVLGFARYGQLLNWGGWFRWLI
ncbi:MAG: hypothetical protein JJ872_06270 [Marivivens sp.]|nr:hypothetical protein [Marivivens sp.]